MTTKSQLLRIIRKNCLDCMGGYEAEIPRCTSPACSLFDFRMGKDPRPNQSRVRMSKERGFGAAAGREIIDEDRREQLNP